MIECVGMSGGTTEAFKQKNTMARFVLGKITGRNLQDEFDGAKVWKLWNWLLEEDLLNF